MGTRDAATSMLFTFKKCFSIFFKNCTFANPFHERGAHILSITESKFLSFHKCVFHDITNALVLATRVSDLIFSAITISDVKIVQSNVWSVIQIDAVSRTLVTKCMFRKTDGLALGIKESNSIKLTDNYFTQCKRGTILLSYNIGRNGQVLRVQRNQFSLSRGLRGSAIFVKLKQTRMRDPSNIKHNQQYYVTILISNTLFEHCRSMPGDGGALAIVKYAEADPNTAAILYISTKQCQIRRGYDSRKNYLC